MEVSEGEPQRLLVEPARSTGLNTGENAIAVKDVAGRNHELDKRSLNYVLRSGLAGGLAGCAVGLPPSQQREPAILTSTLGKNSRWAT